MNIRFEPVRWSLNTNIYEVNIRQYTEEGNFAAFAREIPRLQDLGVKILWLMPVTPISKLKRHGTLGSYYACSSYRLVNPEFGTLQDFRQLVNQAHAAGMKVIIDWVANHTGWDHEWVDQHPEYYKRNAQGNFYDNNGWEDVIDLNYYDHAMRRAMISAMEYWVTECDIDGFRCDMAHLVPFDFWKQARLQLDQIKPLFWLAETEHPNYQYVFDCSYAWDWLHLTTRYAAHKASFEDLRHLLTEYQRKKLSYTTHLFFTSNHDENSWNGTEYERYGELALPFAVFSCLWNGIPLVYSGQELPNTKRLKFFDKDPIAWTPNHRLHHFYKTLLGLRNTLGDEPSEVLVLNTGSERQLIAFLKISRLHQHLTIINFSNETQHVHLDSSLLAGRYREIFTDKNYEAPSFNEVSMEPHSYLVLEKI